MSGGMAAGSEPLWEGLYEEVVLRHHRQPCGEGRIASTTHEAAADNPLCGDEVEVFLEVADGVVRRAGFEARACALCRASASMLCGWLTGRTVDEARTGLDEFVAAAASDRGLDEGRWGEVAALGAVRKFPARVRCVLLPWQAAEKAFDL